MTLSLLNLNSILGLWDLRFHLHGYCILLHFLSYTFIWPYTFIDFPQIFPPTRLFRPTLILGTLEYDYGLRLEVEE